MEGAAETEVGCSQIQVPLKQSHSASALDDIRECKAFASKGRGLACHLTWKGQELGVSTTSFPQGPFIASVPPGPQLSGNLSLLRGIQQGT